MADEEVQAFDFDSLSAEEFGQVAESLGITLLPAEEPAEGAETEGGEIAETAEAEAEEQAPDSAEAHGDDAPDSAEQHKGPLDPAGMALVATSCVAEAQGYVASLVQLAEQVSQSDKATGKKIAGLAKKAEGLASDVEKTSEKASKAAEKDKLGETAELARECTNLCAEIRELIDEAKALVGDADLPDDAVPEEPAEPAAPTRSAIEQWADDMLG